MKKSEIIHHDPSIQTSLIGSRYVRELKKMKGTFIDPLLHSFSPTPASSQSNTPHSGTLLDDSRDHDEYSYPKPSEYLERLPTTSRRTTLPVASRSITPVPQQTERNSGLHDDLSKGVSLTGNNEVSVEGIIEGGGADDLPEIPDELMPDFVSLPISTSLHPLEDLRVCLEVIERDLLENHTRFGKALKMCWEEQRTHVRSIEDILVDCVRHLLPFVCRHLTVSAVPYSSRLQQIHASPGEGH